MTSLLLGIIYLAFISLGLPDALLGSAWPLICQEIGVPMSWSGILFMTISLGTVFSSLMSSRVVRRFSAGKVTAFSVALTACALFGFSVSRSFWALWLFAVPYGLGAGGVDAALNNFVALHYASRHMSWLHCMWGVGATAGPAIMSAALSAGQGWHRGYRWIALLQVVLTVILCASLPLWKRQDGGPHADSGGARLSLRQILLLPGVGFAMLCFFCYCALEQTVNLWASSYLVTCEHLDPVRAAGFASLFFIGITAGRGLSGFITYRLNDRQMILLGQGVIAVGIAAILLPLGTFSAYLGLITVGLGCAPIYPCLIHATPGYFGADRSQAVIGMEMACAYVGTSCMPPFFGFLADWTGLRLFPVFLLILLLVMGLSYRKLEGRKIYHAG